MFILAFKHVTCMSPFLQVYRRRTQNLELKGEILKRLDTPPPDVILICQIECIRISLMCDMSLTRGSGYCD